MQASFMLKLFRNLWHQVLSTGLPKLIYAILLILIHPCPIA